MIGLGMLKQRARVERGLAAAAGTDSTGYFDPWTTPTLIADNVPCSRQPRSERTKVYSEGRCVNGRVVIYFNMPIDIRENDRITISGVVFDVLKPDDAAGREHHWEVGVEPFQPNQATP